MSTRSAPWSGAAAPRSSRESMPWLALRGCAQPSTPERLAGRAEHTFGKEEHYEYEEDSEDEQPARGQPLSELGAAEEHRESSEVREQESSGEKDSGADQAAPQRADAADDDHEQHVQHDRHAQRRLRIHVAHPHEIATAHDGGDHARERRGSDLEGEGGHAQRLRAELIVPDGLERPAQWGDHEAAHDEEESRAHAEHDVVGHELARERDAEHSAAVVGDGE